jgi:hypothetical protein
MASDIPDVHRVTIGADKGYDCKGCVDDLRSLTVTPHVTQVPPSTAGHSSWRLCREPEKTQTGGRDIRLDEKSSGCVKPDTKVRRRLTGCSRSR